MLLQINPDGLSNGLAHIVKLVEQGKEWPPSPIVFASLCKKPLDTDEAFIRMVRHQKPENPAERKARAESNWHCRNRPEAEARAVFTKSYAKYYERYANGTLQDEEPKALPKTVATTEFDRMREEAIRNGKYNRLNRSKRK